MKRITSNLFSLLIILAALCVPSLCVKAEDNCNHNLEIRYGYDASCVDDGLKDCYICTICSDLFADEEGKIPVTESELVIPAYGHYFEEEHSARIIKRATTTKDGKVGYPCVECGEIKKTGTIYKVGDIKISSVTYNGKTRIPVVKITDSKGHLLYNEKDQAETADYRVTLSKTRKNVGRYQVKITFINRYSGEVTKTFDIKSKTTKITKLIGGKKKITVKWKKQTSQTSGYQIQYGTSSKFKGAKTLTVSRNRLTSGTITKLKSKKNYYVRIRTYKNVLYGKKWVKIYSDWSTAKAVNVK